MKQTSKHLVREVGACSTTGVSEGEMGLDQVTAPFFVRLASGASVIVAVFSDAVTTASWHFSFTSFEGNSDTCVKNMLLGHNVQGPNGSGDGEREALGTS